MRRHAPGTRAGLASLLAFLLAGCEILILDPTTRHGELNAALRDTVAEIHLHDDNLHGAPSLLEARVELERHRLAMIARDRDLSRHVGAMSCIADGADDLGRLVARVKARVEAYLAEAMNAATMPELEVLCRAYGDDMDLLLHRMGDEADRLGCED